MLTGTGDGYGNVMKSARGAFSCENNRAKMITAAEMGEAGGVFVSFCEKVTMLFLR